MTPFFTYHSGMQALIIHNEQGQQVGGMRTADIRRAGWKCDDAALMLALPRSAAMPRAPNGAAPDIRPPTAQEMAALARRARLR
jgi:hypothetical protein